MSEQWAVHNTVIKNINDLIEYDSNPREHTPEQVEQVANSIKEFGWTMPILIDDTNEIIAGHGRLMAGKKLGIKEVPCIVAQGWSDEQKKAYCIADNKLTENSTWSKDFLKLNLNNLYDNEFDLKLTGFSDDELSKLLPDFNIDEGLTDEDDVPTPPEEPVTKLGDIWLCGEHRVMCGDSFDKKCVVILTKNTKIKLLLTDPPYELITEGGGILKDANSMNQIKENNVDKFNPSELILYAETNIFFHNKPLIKKYIELAEVNNSSYDLCFYKKENTAPNYGGHMMTDVEYIAIIGKQSPNKGFNKEMYSKLFTGKKDLNVNLSYAKPVSLCEKYIKLYSDKYVLDIFGGSGSTLIACQKNNKKCYMMEISPKYCDVIVKRWQNYTGQEATLESDGAKFNDMLK